MQPSVVKPHKAGTVCKHLSQAALVALGTGSLHVQGELDELEREEFFRLKKVQAKKKRDAELKDLAKVPALA